MVALACAGSAFAVGLYNPGKEPCKPGTIGATGKVPDVMNQLAEAFVFPSVFRTLDKIAGEIKAILGQFGVKTSKHYPVAEVKYEPKTSVQKTKKPRKFKKINRPARAL
jgi:hypothetical protein